MARRQATSVGCSVNDVGKHNQSGTRVAVGRRYSLSSRSGPNTLVTTPRQEIAMTTEAAARTPKPAPAQYFPVDSVMCLLRHVRSEGPQPEPAAGMGSTDDTR